ncbi:MAG: hypothetical protein ACK5MD_05680 [Flavobacteriales bacterium]
MTVENTQRKKYQSVSHGIGITGLILGILTLLVSFIPCFGIFAIIFGVIGVLISLVGLGIALKHDHPKGLIIGALITAFLGCAIAYSQYSAIRSIGEEAVKHQNKIEQQQNK